MKQPILKRILPFAMALLFLFAAGCGKAPAQNKAEETAPDSVMIDGEADLLVVDDVGEDEREDVCSVPAAVFAAEAVPVAIKYGRRVVRDDFGGSEHIVPAVCRGRPINRGRVREPRPERGDDDERHHGRTPSELPAERARGLAKLAVFTS